jgi:iron complex transport system ATP-binding protein
MTPLLALDQATVALPGHRFGPFNLQMRAGEHVALVGPSGAGKSTLLRLIAGERSPSSGRLRLADEDPAALGTPRLARQRAVLPQSHAVAFAMPVELVVTLGRIAVEDDPQRAHIVEQALCMARAAHLVGRRFDTLSGGEQARVHLARVMAQLWDVRGGLLLVDEPLAALDPGLQLELLDAITGFTAQRGHALLAIVHDLNQALAGFERLWLLRQGRVIADLPADRSAVPALAELFGVSLQVFDTDGGRVAVLPTYPRPALRERGALQTQAPQDLALAP